MIDVGRMGGGFGRLGSSGRLRSPISAEARAFFDRLATTPGSTRQAVYDAFFTPLVQAGIFPKFDAYYLFAGDDSPTALTSLVSDTYNATAIGAPTFTANSGFTGADGKYIDTNFNPTTAVSPKLTQNDGSLFAWSLTSGVSNGGICGNSETDTYIFPRWTDGKLYLTVNATDSLADPSADGSGFWGVSRTGASTQYGSKNGVNVGTQFGSEGSKAPLNANIHFLRTTPSFFDGACAGGGFGSQFSAAEHIIIYNAMRTYLQAVGAVA